MTKTLKSESPSRLPGEFLPELLGVKRLLLCLDYDGTISEIVRDPATARPVPGVPEILTELASHRDRIKLAIVSGREVAKLSELLPVPQGVALSGIHGLELVGFDGREKIIGGAREGAEDLESVRRWLGERVPAREGFEIEDKRFAITLHYRNAPAATARHIREAFLQFIRSHAPRLTTLDSKMAVEAVPRNTSKASAVRALGQCVGKDFEPVYFGDDVTDEDAFREIGGRGVTILVGKLRPSAARYRVESPREVVRVLKEVALALTQPRG
jgi:trehalose-phosphatase